MSSILDSVRLMDAPELQELLEALEDLTEDCVSQELDNADWMSIYKALSTARYLLSQRNSN